MHKLPIAGLVVVLAGMGAHADSITIDGKRHDAVIVRESAALYYVQDTATGTITNVAKDRVAAGGWVRTSDPAERQQLNAAWKAAQARHNPQPAQIQAPKAGAASAEREGDPATPQLAARGGEARSDGRVPYLRLKNVPLRDALDATLRPLNLDYTTAGGFLYISTPERIAHESFEPIETRTYNINLDQTLPKIVLSNRFGAASSGLAGNNLGGGGFGSGGGGGGAGFRNSGGFGGGNQGGFSQQSGFGAQGGNQGSLNNQNTRDVTAISNISELFTTIDDRLVGETPAQIGLGIQSTR